MSYSPTNPNGQATMANSEPVVIASNQSAVSVTDTNSAAALTALQLIDDPVGSTAAAVPAKAMYVGFSDGTNVVAPRVNVNGDGVAASLLQGINLFGYNGSGYDRIGNGNGTAATRSLRVTVASDSTGQIASAANATATGFTVSQQNALTNTKVSVKTSAGNLYGYRIYNPNTTYVYIQVFNLLTASVTLGTTAATEVIPIPPGGMVDEVFPVPGAYGTGIVIAATTTATGSTAPTSTLTATMRYL